MRTSNALLSAVVAVLLTAGCGGGGGDSGSENSAPVANAGTPQSVVTGTLVTLNGGASSDADGDPLTYSWSLTSKPPGSAATLSGANSVAPSFTADRWGNYVVTLIVNDGQTDSAPVTVTVTADIPNEAPVAVAGTAQSVVVGTVVTLDGSGSWDINYDTLAYAWTLTNKPTGSAATLSGSTSVKPTFTADVTGTYVATLVVNDGKLDSAPATVTVTASDSCASSPGDQQSFTYDWSLATQKITFTNNNSCDKLHIWATSTPLCTGCTNEIVDIFADLNPGSTITLDAGVPADLGWKPDVIYSLPNGTTYAFHAKQAGTVSDQNLSQLLLDHSETYEGTLAQFSTMFTIDPRENVRGDCANFAWVDRSQGKYRISANSSQKTSYCFVGNITGYTAGGDAVNLPAVRYFVTDTKR